MHDIITKEIGRNYHLIPNSKFPIIYHPNSTVLSVSDNVVYKMCSDGSYTPDEIDLITYIKDVRFATMDQIERAFPDCGFTFERVFELVNEYILNAIVLGEREDMEVFKRSDSLIIFTLDVGGTYVLNYAGVNSNKWSLKESHQSTRVIKRLLAQGEFYLKIFNREEFDIREFIPRRQFSVGRTVAEVDFAMSISKDSTIRNILGFVVEDGIEDLNFRSAMADLDLVFNETQAWKKDYPISEKPTFVMVVYSTESLMKVAKIITTSTTFKPMDINIILYDQLTNNDIDALNIFSYNVNDLGKIKLGKLTRHALS